MPQMLLWSINNSIPSNVYCQCRGTEQYFKASRERWQCSGTIVLVCLTGFRRRRPPAPIICSTLDYVCTAQPALASVVKCIRLYSLGRQVVKKVLLTFFWKFIFLVWAAWQLQYSPTACGTLRKHFSQPAAPDCKLITSLKLISVFEEEEEAQHAII